MNFVLSNKEKEDIQKEINKVFDKLYVKNLLEKSIKENCALSQYKLAKYYMYDINNEKQGFYWYKKSAEQGNDKAQYYIANCYALGIGVEYNMHEAIRWCLKSALQNNKVAQYQLGSCYENGKIGSVNIPNAIMWYQKAVAQGVKEAQYHLGKFTNQNKIQLK